MKTLVIHPKDISTNFLSVIYAGKGWDVINDPDVSKKILKEQIKSHDRIIMLGHGTENGLVALRTGNYRFVVDARLVYLLRKKDCVCIWCNADQFVRRYDIKGFYTGMIISELEEAYMYNIYPDNEQLAQSNVLFADSIKQSIESPNILSEVKTAYNSEANPVIYFNKQNIYHSEFPEILEDLY